MDFNITFSLAFFAGLASFLSPCVFALVPAYIGYLSGRAVNASEDENNTWQTVKHGIAFVLGFSIVFILLGALFGALGRVLSDITDILIKVGGAVVIVFGLHMSKIIQIPFLNYDTRKEMTSANSNNGYVSSAMMGVFFSAGWAPCVGPVLGAILTLTLNGGSISEGAYHLAAYSAGLGIPFLLAATQVGWVTKTLRKYGRVMHYVEVFLGVLMIGIGILLFSNRLGTLASYGLIFGDVLDEIAIGQSLLYGLLIAIGIGLLVAYFAKSQGKKLADYWIYGTSLAILAGIILTSSGTILFGVAILVGLILGFLNKPEEQLFIDKWLKGTAYALLLVFLYTVMGGVQFGSAILIGLLVGYLAQQAGKPFFSNTALGVILSVAVLALVNNAEVYTSVATLGIGLIAGAIAHRQGKPFIDYTILGASISLVVMAVLYTLGVFNSLLPYLVG